MSATEPLPAPLKIPEISRFINRANQLRSFKPSIAYWCEYRAVNQIVTRSLHTADDESFAFTKSLIERLEATKSERANDDAIVDNIAGQAYVEQFAQETFSRAERAMRACKVTRQTADTFDAAATFFDLTHEWGTPEIEVLKKIKFAKWNAARILKAIREGKDPNESNPTTVEEPEQMRGLDDASTEQVTNPTGPRSVSVEEVVDLGEAPNAPAPESYFPPTSATITEPFSPSPLGHSPGAPAPGIPPPAAPVSPVASSAMQVPMQPSPQISTKLPSQFAPPPPEPSAPDPQEWPNAPAATQQLMTPPTVQAPLAPVREAPIPVSSASQPRFTPDLKLAQKHARFAVSALDFEDIQAAVEQLREALRKLGAQ